MCMLGTADDVLCRDPQPELVLGVDFRSTLEVERDTAVKARIACFSRDVVQTHMAVEEAGLRSLYLGTQLYVYRRVREPRERMRARARACVCVHVFGSGHVALCVYVWLRGCVSVYASTSSRALMFYLLCATCAASCQPPQELHRGHRGQARGLAWGPICGDARTFVTVSCASAFIIRVCACIMQRPTTHASTYRPFTYHPNHTRIG